MAKIETSSPFLKAEDDFFDLEAVVSTSSARCGQSKLWLGAYLGEKATLPPPQTSVPLDPTRSLWYESMQDMSGYVLSDTTLPQSDEQLDFTISTAQTENDFYVQIPDLPSEGDFYVGDTYEDLINEESDMFDSTICETFNSKTIECQPESPIKINMYDYLHLDQTGTTTIMDDEGKIFIPQKLPFCRPKGKLTGTAKSEQPKYLAIIDSEEPQIKEDPDLFFTNPTKMDINIKSEMDISDIFHSYEPTVERMDKEYCTAEFKDMGVAEEVVVVTEEDDEFKTNMNISILDSIQSVSEEDLSIPEAKIKKEDDLVFQIDPFLGLDVVMSDWFNGLDQISSDECMKEDDCCVNSSVTSKDYSHITIPSVLLSNSTNNEYSFSTDLLEKSKHQETVTDPLKMNNKCQATSKTPLTLDISAARAAILDDKGISDTPELLEALKPEIGKFDLIKFITSNGDPNNNAVSPPPVSHPNEAEPPRKGKSHLSLKDLKHSQQQERGESLSRTEHEPNKNRVSPSTSGISSTGRPSRQSAKRFKRLIEEGLLSSSVDNHSVSSDEEDTSKSKRRRTTSTTSSRRRLNSDSDRSSISGDAMKYRERRDRNNLSSKLSRQKRKMQHQLKQKELKELEERNAKLKSQANQLELVLNQIKAVWSNKLVHMKKDNDKDRGDEHF